VWAASDVAAVNIIGTLLYFVLFNLGRIVLAAPVQVPTQVVTLDRPFLIGVTWLVTLFLWRGRVARWQDVLLLVVYAGYVTAHALLSR
jgi:cation:H+ antiporter